MFGVRAHEFNFTPLLCTIIGSTTNPAKCGKTPVNGVKTPGNGIKSPGYGINPREMQMTHGNSRAYFASNSYNKNSFTQAPDLPLHRATDGPDVDLQGEVSQHEGDPPGALPLPAPPGCRHPSIQGK